MGYWGTREDEDMIEDRRQRGSLTVEATIVLVIFIFGYATIITIGSFIHAQMIIQHGITQAARELSAYCYLVSKTGIMEDSERIHGEAGEFKNSTDDVIDTVVKLYDAVDQGTDHIVDTVKDADIDENSLQNKNLEDAYKSVQDVADVTQEEFNQIVSAANTMISTGNEYFSDPKAIMNGLASMAKDGALSAAKSYVIAAPVSKALVKKQVDLYGKNGKDKDILESLGVVNGINGLNFVGSTLFNDGKTITVQVSYTMKVEYPWFNKFQFHFIQAASTKAWGSETGGRPWRD